MRRNNPTGAGEFGVRAVLMRMQRRRTHPQRSALTVWIFSRRDGLARSTTEEICEMPDSMLRLIHRANYTTGQKVAGRLFGRRLKAEG